LSKLKCLLPNDLLLGLSKMYYENGQLKETKHYVKDELDGVDIKYNDDRSILRKYT
jgi:antitoxin component YwqK of YwqJK toxin-antitoxin module